MLIEKGRLKLDIPSHIWRQDLLSAGLREVAVDGEIGITAATLEGFHGDPADRLSPGASELTHAGRACGHGPPSPAGTGSLGLR